VRAGFLRDPQVAAGFSPFRAVGRDVATTRSGLGQEMGQFVSQSAIDLVRAVLAQARVQGNEFPPVIGPAGCTEKARVPFYLDRSGEISGVQST